MVNNIKNCDCGNFIKRETTNFIRLVDVCANCGRLPPQEEKWMPKVGEKCLFQLDFTNSWFKCTYCGKYDDTHWLRNVDNADSHHKDRDVVFKPLPPSLEEQLAHDILSMNYPNLSPQTIAHRLIEKGWKK